MDKYYKVTLKNNLKIPILGLGTWNLKGGLCERAVRVALDLGYRHIDTAEVYRNEIAIGKAIKDFEREKLFIVSKVWPGYVKFRFVLPPIWPIRLTPNQIISDCKKSLSKLKTNYLDLYLIHWPNENMNLKKVCLAFKKLRDEGKIRAFGVSNFTIRHLKKIIPVSEHFEIPICVNQVEFHPLLYQKNLLEFCRNNGIFLTAYSPLARGEILFDKTLKEISEKYRKTPAQISLRWLMQKKIIVIPKASSKKHLSENINIFDFELMKEDVKKIDEINKKERTVNPFFASFD